MSLSETLKAAIEQEAEKLNLSTLLDATQQMSQRYRNAEQRKKILENKQRFLANDAQRSAYILARMPATFGALKYVLNQLKEHSATTLHSALDIGAGPGTALWAMADIFPNIQQITLLEQDQALIQLGKKLATKCTHPLFQKATWMQTDISKQERFVENDLITASYIMGEWPQTIRCEIVKKLWDSTKKALVIVEPGTMSGFEVIRQVRQQLIKLGACMIAPCPHTLRCPMPEDDWCHFNIRIARSRMHRLAKGGSLGYEDEKFSYVVVAKSTAELPDARVLRHPLKRSGHLSLFLCTKHQGLEQRTISRRDGELYKYARNLDWGDII